MRNIYNFLLGLVAIAACWQAWHIVYQDSIERAPTAATSKPEECLAVEVLPVRTQTLAERIELVGSLQPHVELTVRARNSGYISELPLDLGDRVKAGQVLLRLDDQAAREAVARAEAAVTVAQAERDAQKTVAEQATRNRERIDALRQSGAATVQQAEDARALDEVARARLALEEARVVQAQSELSQMRIELQTLELQSPIDGVVAERFVHVGDLAQPNEPLLRIVGLSLVETSVHVTERDYDRLRSGQAAVLTVDAHPGQIFHGRVARVAPVVDPATRTAAVRIEAPNDRGLLRPGMHARVTVLCDQPRSAGVVPVAALKEEDAERCVFVVHGEPPTIERREVRVGLVDGLVAEVLAGLKPGERVVTLGSRLVRHGQLVRPIETTWPVALATAADGRQLDSSTVAEE